MSQSVKDVPWLKRLFNSVKSVFSLTAGMSIALDARGWPMNSIASIGKKTSYDKTTSGAQALLGAALLDRHVQIIVTVNETFAAGNGAATSFGIGETGTATKFKSGLNSGTAAAQTFYQGTLSAGKELLVTGTAATGTGAGGIDVSAIAVPLAS
jgi:hypothetical protein